MTRMCCLFSGQTLSVDHFTQSVLALDVACDTLNWIKAFML